MKPVYGFNDLKKLLSKEKEFGEWQRIAMTRGKLFHEILIDDLSQLKPGTMGSNPHKDDDMEELDYESIAELRDAAASYAAAISQHPYFSEASRVDYEFVCTHEYPLFTGRASIDMVLYYPDGGVQLWDFKTVNAGFRALGTDSHHIKRYFYDMQMAFYLDVFENSQKRQVTKYCLAFCNTNNGRVSRFYPYEFDPESVTMNSGAQRLEKAVALVQHEELEKINLEARTA